MLRTIGIVAWKLVVASAWLILVMALALLVLEESGVMADYVHARVSWRLGPLGKGLTIERVSLRWFEPGIVLEGIGLRAPGDEDGPGAELLRLRSVHIAIHPDLSAGALRQVNVEGGRVRISDELLEGISRFASTLPSSPGEATARLSAPPVLFTNLEVLLELPDESAIDIGTADVLVEPEGEGRLRISGRIVPSLAGAVPTPGEVHVNGFLWEGGVELHASARDIALETRGIKVPAAMGALPVAAFSGHLTLDAEARFEFGDLPEAAGSLRASVTDARLAPTEDLPPLEELEIEAAVDFHPGPEMELWNRGSWSSTVRATASWHDAPLLAWGLFGLSVPGGDWARIWARSAELPLGRSSVEAFKAPPEVLEVWDALEPDGTADAVVDWILEEPAGPGALEGVSRVAAHLRHERQSSVTFRGWRDPRGERDGVPIPCTELDGDVIAFLSNSRERPLRLGIVDTETQHGSGKAFVSGMLISPDPATGFPKEELDLFLEVPAMAIDERLEDGLAANPSTREIFPSYEPTGGTVSASWRWRQGADVGGATGQATIRIAGTNLRWASIPVPLEDVSGELQLRWADTPTRVIAEDGERRTRGWGVAYRLSNTGSDVRGVEARCEGFGRTDTLAPVLAEEDLPTQVIQSLELESDELLLRGRDWEILTLTFPALGEQSELLSASGGLAVRFVGTRAAPEAVYTGDVEATPNVLESTPSFFRRRARGIAGRILVRTEEDGAATTSDLRLNLTGSWPGGVDLAAQGRVTTPGSGTIEVHGTGIDPSNNAFRAALYAVLTGDEGTSSTGVGNPALTGRLDFSARTEIISPSPEPARNEVRVFLRNNALIRENLRLDRLHGVLEMSDSVLFGQLVLAELAGHPVQLRDVAIFSLADVDRLLGADPLLRRGGFWSDPSGVALQAELFTSALPLDEAHLSSFVGKEMLDVLTADENWRGVMDIPGARILLIEEADDEQKVAIHGTVRPRDLSLSLGLPIEVEEALLEIEELILEAGRYRGWAQVESLDARIAERELSDAKMVVGYVDGRLTIDNLSGDFEGGRLESLGGEGPGARKALGIDLAAPNRFDIAMRLVDVRVDGLMRGVFESPIADQGTLNGGLELAGVPGEILGLRGAGWFRLEEGKLWSIPVMRELFSQLGMDETAVFDSMRARFRLRDGTIETSDVNIRSDLLQLVGSGWLDLGGSLAYDLEVRYSLLEVLGPINRLLYWLNNSLWRVAARGSIDRPRVTIRNSLVEFLSGFDDDPPRALPLPAFARQSPAF